METENEALIEAAITRMAAAVSEGRTPHRHDAREILVPLGLLILEDSGSAAGHVQKVRKLGRAWAEPWEEAVKAEVALACAEHIHSADPRYLGLPNYDWDYTKSARQRLEARLSAAGALGHKLDEMLVKAVKSADEVLANHSPGGDAGA